MIKAELITKIAESNGVQKKVAEEAVNMTLKAISDSLTAGESIVIPGFGSFKVTERAAREGRNPSTGEKLTIAASKAVSFKAGKTLKDAVNK